MREVIEQVLHFQCSRSYSLPLNVEALCRSLGLELRKLTDIARESGLAAGEICAVWGNPDGVLQRVGGRWVLSYNDRQPLRRRRFTLCEEAAHCLLGHLDEPGFQMFSQGWREEVYRRCEEEARFAAGLLLCPPRWFFAQDGAPTAQEISRCCRVSPACARRILEDYARWGGEIRRCPAFGFAPLAAGPLPRGGE